MIILNKNSTIILQNNPLLEPAQHLIVKREASEKAGIVNHCYDPLTIINQALLPELHYIPFLN